MLLLQKKKEVYDEVTWETFSVTNLIIFIGKFDQKVFMTIQMLISPSVKNIESLQESPFKWSFSPFCANHDSK